jgi:hypothetical protein
MKRGLIKTFVAGILIFQASCHQSGNTRIGNLAPSVHQVIAKEVLQATNYTYIQVKEEDNQYWVAITKSDIKTGGTYYWSQGMPMENFPSKDLNRTFPLLYLVQNFTDKPITQEGQSSSSSSWTGNQPATEQQDISLTPAGNGITLEELFSHKDQYAGKSVIVRGKVVKYNPHIMDKNWIHIQDGTKSGEDFDLALTSSDEVKIGDVVTFEGIITLDKDFGAGYFYKVIMEDAKQVTEQ